MREAFKKAGASRLEKLSDDEILGLYLNFERAYAGWYAVGWLAEPVAIQSERLLSGLLTKKGLDSESKEFKRGFSLLTSTTRESFNRREEEEFLEIASKVKSGAGADSGKLLRSHAAKWFWLHNNYLETKVLGVDFFEGELKRVLAKHPEPSAYAKALRDSTAEIARDKKKAIAELNLVGDEKALVGLIDLFGWFQDHRKEVVLQSLHYFDLLLAEIACRSGFTLREVKQLLHEEIPVVLTGGKIDKTLLRKRLENCVLVWRPDGSSESWAGAAAREKEKTLFKNDSASRDVVEIRGSVACQGKARGYARVTMSAAEANSSLRSGEILVTSMTSPDFVTAVKRAAAIVTNEGGITCHAAIVSREFGIPCIVGTRIATKVIKTGDYVEVDGNHGFVRKLVKE